MIDKETLIDMIFDRYSTLRENVEESESVCSLIRNEIFAIYKSYCTALVDVCKKEQVCTDDDRKEIDDFIKECGDKLLNTVDVVYHKHSYLQAVENLSRMTKTYPKILDLVLVADFDDIIKLDKYTFQYNHPDYDYQNFVLYKELCDKYGV